LINWISNANDRRFEPPIHAIMSSPQSVLRKSKLTLPSRVVLAGVIASIYVLACCFPALRLDHYYPGSNTPRSSETWFGWTALFLGWLGILVGSVAWLANFVLGLTVVFLLSGVRWASLICSTLTLLLSLDFFPLFSAKIPADEGGVGQAVLQPPEIGVWLWFASIAAKFLATWVLFLAPRKGVQGVGETGKSTASGSTAADLK
jgi:hypothetical protein